jgi:hypothetical protein
VRSKIPSRSTLSEPSLFLPSEVTYGSFLIYSPKGIAPTSVDSRRVTYAIKQDGSSSTAGKPMIDYAAARLKALIGGSVLQGFLGPDVLLIPAPRSVPLLPHALWPGKRICEALVGLGLGADVACVLRRHTPVAKSSWAAHGDRTPPMGHYETIDVDKKLIPQTAPAIVVVDDVITKGSMAIACAARVREAFPRADVRWFAMVRTKGLIPDVDRLVEPFVGTIKFANGKAIRGD